MKYKYKKMNILPLKQVTARVSVYDDNEAYVILTTKKPKNNEVLIVEVYLMN